MGEGDLWKLGGPFRIGCVRLNDSARLPRAALLGASFGPCRVDDDSLIRAVTR